MYKSGQRVKDIAIALDIKYGNVFGVIDRARARGIVTYGSRYSEKQRVNRALRQPAFRLGSIRQSIVGGMDEATYYGIVKKMTTGGYVSFAEYLVDIAVENYCEEQNTRWTY